MKSSSLLASFRYAADGLVHALNVDWHLRYILLVGVLALLASAMVSLTRVEVLLLLVALTLVLLAELFNRAIEAVVDLVSPGMHPLAKVAKDVGGAGVLVAVLSGLMITAGVFLRAEPLDALRQVGQPSRPHFVHVLVVGAVAVVVAVVLAKVWEGHWNLTRGGMVSAHSALAFFCFVSVCYLTTDVVIWALTLLPAILVAQSRVEAGIHNVREVLIGAAVALSAGGLLYGFLAMRGGG